ncbi:Sensor protein TorS [Posidoniimonas polymericola]|uniref:histidine kinase n=1 Tax=Posidoniimonas polymericola TaxID=2528002 RepID=A0A5C5YTA1_9BACT|nr:hybrid sensor histidine kinase/response regulator [Posidoniimonas polymericola]TWT78036.1 Sensor protein TorS [Posidoniimonas polymericola]
MKRRVLIIDDTPEDREIVTRALRQDSQVRYDLKEVTSGTEGLNELQRANSPYDLVFLDYQLPDMNAEQFVSKLIGPDQAPAVPIIVLTGSMAVDFSAIGPLEHGVQDFFTKNEVTPEVLGRVAKNAIERHRLLRRLVDSERAADEARESAERASRAKSHFLTLISHELRTPLTAILGFAKLLTDNPSAEDADQMLRMVSDSGEHLRDLLNDLIDMAKVEAGTLDVEMEEFNPSDVIRATCQLMELRASDKGLTLTHELADNIPPAVCSDPTRVRQVLINLLGNAIKFSETGGIRCRAVYDEQQTKLVMLVSDTGPGVPDSLAETLFTPFVQGGRNSKDGHREGVGLGLAISHRLAEMMGGDLSLESTGQSGSTFRFSVLAEEPGSSDSSCGTRVAAETVSSDAAPDFAGKRVLVAEDTLANQYLIRRLLEPTGVGIEIAENGAEAVRLAANSDFDLILMDMLMPVMDGYTATEQLCQQDCPAPIIAITAAAIASDNRRCRRAGCADIITKPIDSDRLFSVLAHYLQK